jgi:ketosteroid isomerase-like protein
MGANMPLHAQQKADGYIWKLLQFQADAWNRGDLDSFMTGYLDSPDTSYTSGGKEIRGYQALKEHYQTRYGTSRDTMGKLTFRDLRSLDLGDDHALCIGRWLVQRAGSPDISGIFSLVLVRSGNDWKVLHDHTSLDAPPPPKTKDG